MRVAVELDVPARMRDGVVLRANVYRPEGAGSCPVLLTRTPYGKDLIDPLPRLDPIQAARNGFVVVIQDTRGRSASDGDWDPFRYEAEDGYDTVEWAARLPGSNGRVAMFGDSYCGNTQWLAAIEQPPSLAAIAPAMTWSDPLDGLMARGGAVELGLGLPWSLAMAADEVTGSALSDDLDRLGTDGYWQLPTTDLPVLKRHGISTGSMLRGVDDAAFADRCRIAGRHDEVAVPTLHTAGWYDILLQGTLDNYAAMAALGREARLVVGPWTHVDFGDPIGELRFGVRAARYGGAAHPEGDVNDLQLAWFRRHLMSDAAPAESAAPVRLFVMGRNAWRDEERWPPTRSRDEMWFLHADGTLGPSAPASDDGRTTFAYDPADPVPTRGGAVTNIPGAPGGPFEQAAVEARTDVCVFMSAPLEQELEVTGRVRAVLHAHSSAPSTDWVVRLCDVHPDGRSFPVCDGILRVARGADERARHEVDLWSTSIVLLRGHRLRVQVTSSCFPRWDRNLNTGDQRGDRHQIAHQCIHHGAEAASWIELPVRR